ncbi:glycosyl hydrolase family 28-related protein [Mangrovibacterium sp.]|uniref:glycosyl hydrolase family 28-related protein n=1 Tax=Mangrovibacterium sp. TaxID=1961364 RepID=UPI0035659AD0
MTKLLLLTATLFFTTLFNATAQEVPFLNIKSFGAKGDGQTDDTAALQKAMEAATESEGTIYFPHGNYCIHPVKVPSHITLLGYSAWAYANKDNADPDFEGKTILTALSGDDRALLDLGNNRGVRILGLTIDGKNLGQRMHGIYARHSGCEQYNCIEDCRIQHFTGSGIRLERS